MQTLCNKDAEWNSQDLFGIPEWPLAPFAWAHGNLKKLNMEGAGRNDSLKTCALKVSLVRRPFQIIPHLLFGKPTLVLLDSVLQPALHYLQKLTGEFLLKARNLIPARTIGLMVRITIMFWLDMFLHIQITLYAPCPSCNLARVEPFGF